MTKPSYFSGNYSRARTRFLEAARGVGAELEHFPLDACGPNGEELAIDLARLGPSPCARLLVLGSGIHGVEGFAGSAIQLQLLDMYRKNPNLPEDLGVLLVHAINPYGFARVRRANESNVDLNRNFLRHPDEHVPNPDYERLSAAINPADLSPGADEKARMRFAQFVQERGARALQVAISQGQYSDQKGIYYGGEREEASARIVREVARTQLRGARHCAWVDLHTGLGEFGDYVMLYEAHERDPAFVRGRRWYGDKAQAEADGQALSPRLAGTIDEGVRGAAPAACELTFFAQEFGTYDTARVFWATRAENWLHHHGDRASEQGRAITAELREVFCPADSAWRRHVLEGGARVIEQAIHGLLSEPL